MNSLYCEKLQRTYRPFRPDAASAKSCAIRQIVAATICPRRVVAPPLAFAETSFNEWSCFPAPGIPSFPTDDHAAANLIFPHLHQHPYPTTTEASPPRAAWRSSSGTRPCTRGPATSQPPPPTPLPNGHQDLTSTCNMALIFWHQALHSWPSNPQSPRPPPAP